MHSRCPNCRKAVMPTDRFCGSCGAALSKGPQAASIDPAPSAAITSSAAITRVDDEQNLQGWINAAMPRDRSELHRLAGWLFGFTILFWLVLGIAFGFASWVGFIWMISTVTFFFSSIAFIVIGWMKRSRFSALVTGKKEQNPS
jgi:hypothetical protein